MIVIYTRAYNAECTLRATMDSVLNQTYTNFRYVLLDNGSIDSTLDIMREYAQRDKRVIILSRTINAKNFSSCLEILNFIINNFSNEDYFCNIDADDTYQPDFMEHMIYFAMKNQLDTVFCGYNVLERTSGKFIANKKVEENLIIENEDLPKYFKTFRRFTTDMWGKLFKVSLLKYYLDSERFEVLKNFNHTQQNFIYDALSNSGRLGLLSETLMDYYESDTAQKNMRMDGQVSLIQYRDIFRIMEGFLDHFETSDKLYRHNKNYIYAVYFGYIKDCISVIKLTNAMSYANKIAYYFDIFSHHITKEMLCLEAEDEFYSLHPESKESLCNSVVSFMLSQEGYEVHKVKINKIIATMKKCGISLRL